MKLINSIIAPPKINSILRFYKRYDPIKILDIGCGNGSPTIFKYWFPNSIYHGLDIQEYNLSENDMASMDKFILVKPGESYSNSINSKYDCIVLNHVIEHMNDSNSRISELSSFVNKGGIMYLAFPSVETLSFPPAIGTLNFCDDTTHVHVPCIREVSNILIGSGMKIIYAGRKRHYIRTVLGLPILIIQIFSKYFIGKMYARGLWGLYKFEATVLAQK